MSRVPLLALILCVVAACDREPAVVAVKRADGGRKATVKPPPVAPTTGIGQVQKGHDEIRREIAKIEKELEGGKRPQVWLVEQQVKVVKNLIVAAELAIKEETRMQVRHSHGQLRLRESELIKRRSEVSTEIQEIRRILDESAKGVGKIPAGFTTAELKDRLGDFQEMSRDLNKQQDELRAEMRRKEALLREDTIPPQEETLFTRELEALEVTKKRVEALRARLN